MCRPASQTFDNVWEASEIQSQYLFARLVFFQSDRPPEPPPFNILRLPTYMLHYLLRLLLTLVPARYDGAHGALLRWHRRDGKVGAELRGAMV